MTDMTLPFPDAFVILSGGRAQRLGGSGGPAGTDRTDDADDGGDAGGTDKASIALGGRTLLDRALGTTQGRPVVIVGPHAPARPRVTLTREDPPGGGPAAGIAAGVAALPTPSTGQRQRIGIMAVDQAGVTSQTWQRLSAAAADPEVKGCVLVEADRRQYGVGVFDAAALRGALGTRADWHGISLRALLDPLIGAEVEAQGPEARDIDTPADLDWWRRRAQSVAGSAGSTDGAVISP
mgnify:FL=1